MYLCRYFHKNIAKRQGTQIQYIDKFSPLSKILISESGRIVLPFFAKHQGYSRSIVQQKYAMKLNNRAQLLKIPGQQHTLHTGL